MESKKFLSPAKIEVDIECLDGSTRHLVCEKITQASLAKIMASGDSDASVGVYEQMAAFFGDEAEDYYDVDARVAKEVIKWMSEQMRDPTWRQDL